MDFKVIAMDFDGTLLTSDKKVTEKTRRVLKHYQDNNHIIVGVTARNLASASNVLDINIFDYIVLNNGAFVLNVKTKEITSYGVLSKDDIDKIEHVFESTSAKCEYCSLNKYYMINADDPRGYIENINSTDEIDEAIVRMNIYVENEEQQEHYKKVIAESIDTVNAVSMRDTDNKNSRLWLTVNNKETSKLNTLTKLCEELSISLNEVIFFGDGENDLLLLENVGMGVAMGNAIDIVKEKSKAIAPSNDEDGIYNYLIKEEFNCSTCMDMQYDLLDKMFFDKREETEKYILCTSQTMDDTFWNMAYLKDKATDETIAELESKLTKMNRIPCLYIGRDDKFFNENKELILSKNYEILDTDVFMILDEYKDVDININVKVVETEKEYNDFMKVLASAYNDSVENADENVYADAVTKCYYDAVKMSINSGKTYHIIGYDNETPVSVATVNISNGVGGINNVGTAQGHWNKGYSKQVLTYLINLFKEKGGKELTLCTEYHSKNQAYYEKLGFKEIYVMEQYVLKGE